MPESFKVLVKELQSLALDVRVLDKNGEEIQFSVLCDDDTPTYRRRNDEKYEDDQFEGTVETDEVYDSYTLTDENGEEIIEAEEDDFSDDFGLDVADGDGDY